MGSTYISIELPKGARGPADLEKAWRNGWDATWWCTSCWIQHRWHMHPPYEDKLKNRMRFKLRILTTDQLYKLWYNSRQYEGQENRRVSSSKHYEVQAHVSSTQFSFVGRSRSGLRSAVQRARRAVVHSLVQKRDKILFAVPATA